MGFSGDMNRLQAIIEEFESEGLGMEDSLALFEEGVGLVRVCREYLEETKRRVTILTSDQEAESEIADEGE
ncbi:MAG: exodeoxyribonuclease VII small subunit [Synergistaceae bacterium]|jgi:exodeoxyribonuclease VII small subunit|nr:exodeoxyribonuclease VII small subunit [Synergistaceae bacterium]